MHETLLRNIYCKNNPFITSTSKGKTSLATLLIITPFYNPMSQKVTLITSHDNLTHDSYFNIPNKVNEITRLARQQSAKALSEARFRKTCRKVSYSYKRVNVQNYGRNRLVFRKLQSVVSSVLIGVNDVPPSMLCDRNTRTFWNLTDLTFLGCPAFFFFLIGNSLSF